VSVDDRRPVDGGRFVADVAHELRGPLTTLIAAVEVLSRGRAQLPERLAVTLPAVKLQEELYTLFRNRMN
jgi:signal transduction histidine kinase